VVIFGSHGGSLVHFRGQLIQQMVRRGHEVIAVAPGIDERLEGLIRDLGAEPVALEFGRASLNLFEALRTGRRIRKLFREVRPDVLIAYAIKPIVLGVPAARASRVPRIVTLVTGLGYAFTEGRELARLFSRASATLLYRRAFTSSDMVLFQNEDDRADFKRLRILPSRTTTGLVNGSGVDIDYFSPSPPPSAASFLMIARLVGDKGLREFAEASRRLKLLHPEVRISLIGGMDTEPHAITPEELQNFISWGIDYLGPQSDVRPFIERHGVYVLPSYREGTPRSVLEALAMGRAVITTDTAGCRQTVDDGVNGLLVPPRDPEALLKAMLRFVDNPQLLEPMGAASRLKAEQKYDVRKVNEDFLQLAHL
jgi:glycosyltransferase involved in cell wall biosynthesis